MLVILKIVGVTITILLLEHTYKKGIFVSFVARICTPSSSDEKDSGCNKVIENENSKLFGLFSWSDLGFIYFAGSILLILYCCHFKLKWQQYYF